MLTRVLVTGRSGQLARALQQAVWPPGYMVEARGRDSLDITDPRAVAAVLAEAPWAAVINGAAFTAVDLAESQRDLAFAVNARGPALLADICAKARIPLVHVSTDYVFDGRKVAAYAEDDQVNPISVYGLSKEAGESEIRARHSMHVILRTSWVFSSTGHNFVRAMLKLGRERSTLSIVADQRGRPTAAADLAAAIVRMVTSLVSGKSDGFGTFHFAGEGSINWYGFANAIFQQAAARGYSLTSELRAIATADYPTLASRPANSVLDTTRIETVYNIRPEPWAVGLSKVLDVLVNESSEHAS